MTRNTHLINNTRQILLGATLALLSARANAALTITTGDALVGDRGTSLIANGSFETGNAGVNLGWTPGSHVGGYPGSEVSSIPSWTSSYPAGADGWWGPLGFQGGAIPDGHNAVYFGNAFNTVGTSTSIAANGVITFGGVPSFSGRPGPVTLSQTVSGLDTSATYRLDFWVSGESNTSGFTGQGLFGLDITGETDTYLLLPTSANAFGASERYYVEFQPSSSSVTIEFLNWGHITDISGQATELVLDDVILNKTTSVPEASPASLALALLGVPALVALQRRRRAA